MTPTQVTPKYIRQISPITYGDGSTLVVGGGRYYHGAPILSAASARRSGTRSRILLSVPRRISETVRILLPDVGVIPFPDEKLTIRSANFILSSVPEKLRSAAIGMGLDLDKPESLSTLVFRLMLSKVRVLLDASALIPEILPIISQTHSVITPHAGEYRRLFGKLPGTSVEEMVSSVSDDAGKLGIVIVLKGETNIVSDGRRTAIVKRTTPAMTVGGSGDVLSGLISALMTRFDPFEASVIGLYFNGLAALSALRRLGLHIMPSDLIHELPSVMKKFELSDNKNRTTSMRNNA